MNNDEILAQADIALSGFLKLPAPHLKREVLDAIIEATVFNRTSYLPHLDIYTPAGWSNGSDGWTIVDVRFLAPKAGLLDAEAARPGASQRLLVDSCAASLHAAIFRGQHRGSDRRFIGLLEHSPHGWPGMVWISEVAEVERNDEPGDAEARLNVRLRITRGF